MNSKDVKGLPVINVSDGSKIGDLERAFIDPRDRRIVGFAIDTGGGFMAPEHALLVDVSEIHSLGPAALTLENANPRGSEMSSRYSELIDLESISGMPFFTSGGTHVGQVRSTSFDERAYSLSSFDVSPGFFQTHRDLPASSAITIGPEIVVAEDDVATPAEPAPSS